MSFTKLATILNEQCDPEQEVTVKFPLVIGVLKCRSIINAIKDYAFMRDDFSLTIDKDRGFLSSHYRINMTGKACDVREVVLWILAQKD